MIHRSLSTLFALGLCGLTLAGCVSETSSGYYYREEPSYDVYRYERRVIYTDPYRYERRPRPDWRDDRRERDRERYELRRREERAVERADRRDETRDAVRRPRRDEAGRPGRDDRRCRLPDCSDRDADGRVRRD
ncbi:hypothetical protein [Ensifer soli]|uniref:hypothetical protein n=1 Tax=Ciceribacter sp. sgz301302 TaxID=3342379 RepID=UPI0035B94FCA